MKSQADKTALNKSKAVANTSSDKQDKRESEAQFEDNRAEVVAQRKLKGMVDNSSHAGKIAQLQTIANGSSPEPVQKQGLEEEEELLQGKFETIQKQEEEEEPLQGKFETIQKEGLEDKEIQAKSAIVQKKEESSTNNTGLPDTLKSGIENLSGLSLDDVKVHYNSPKPTQLQAHAFAQGTDIHMAPGQEKHLPHEAWHVVQQKQGRVQPTKQLKGKVNVNDDVGLEKEADLMGGRADLIFGGATIRQEPIDHKRVLKPSLNTASTTNSLQLEGDENPLLEVAGQIGQLSAPMAWLNNEIQKEKSKQTEKAAKEALAGFVKIVKGTVDIAIDSSMHGVAGGVEGIGEGLTKIYSAYKTYNNKDKVAFKNMQYVIWEQTGFCLDKLKEIRNEIESVRTEKTLTASQRVIEEIIEQENTMRGLRNAWMTEEDIADLREVRKNARIADYGEEAM